MPASLGVRPPLRCSPPAQLLQWGQSQKLIEVAATLHLAENPLSNMRDWLCLRVEKSSLLLCEAQVEIRSLREQGLLDGGVNVTETGLAVRKCFTHCQHLFSQSNSLFLCFGVVFFLFVFLFKGVL